MVIVAVVATENGKVSQDSSSECDESMELICRAGNYGLDCIGYFDWPFLTAMEDVVAMPELPHESKKQTGGLGWR